MSRFISFIISVIMVFGNFQMNLINTVIDSIGSIVTGVPFAECPLLDTTLYPAGLFFRKTFISLALVGDSTIIRFPSITFNFLQSKAQSR